MLAQNNQASLQQVTKKTMLLAKGGIRQCRFPFKIGDPNINKVTSHMDVYLGDIFIKNQSTLFIVKTIMISMHSIEMKTDAESKFKS